MSFTVRTTNPTPRPEKPPKALLSNLCEITAILNSSTTTKVKRTLLRMMGLDEDTIDKLCPKETFDY